MEPKKDTGKRVPGSSLGASAAASGKSALRGTEATAASTGAKPAGFTAGRSTLGASAALGTAATAKPIEEVKHKDGESSGYSDFDEEEIA